MSVAAQHGSMKPMAHQTFEDSGSGDQAPFSDREILTYLTAAQSGDVATLKQFLSKGMPVDTLCLMFAETGLTKACRMGEVETARLLCDWGADVNSRTGQEKETPIHIAVKNCQLEIVKFLLSHGADSDTQDSGDKTPLMLAASMGNPELLKLLTAAGSKVNLVDWRGMSALHHCFFHYQGKFFPSSVTLECVRILVETGADMNLVSYDHWTPLSLAVGHRLTKLVRYFLLQNCDPYRTSMAVKDPHSFNEPGKRAPLRLAALAKDVQTVKLLLLAGSSVNGCTVIKDAFEKESTNSDSYEVIWNLLSQPRSLMESCRIAVRDRLRECNSMEGEQFVQRVDSLNIPKRLRDFILLKELEDM